MSAVSEYINRNRTIDNHLGLFYFNGSELQDVAGKITNLYIDHDDVFVMEGITINTPAGKELEAAIKEGKHCSIALNAYYKDVGNMTAIDKIMYFNIMERNEPNYEWEVHDISSNDGNVQVHDYCYEINDGDDICVDEDCCEDCDKIEPWWAYIKCDDIDTILSLSESVIETLSKKECLEMGRTKYLQEILQRFQTKKSNDFWNDGFK